jgi:hypothetical protein
MDIQKDLQAQKGEEVVTLKLTVKDFEALYNEGFLHTLNYDISRVEPYNEEYNNDPEWKRLKKESNEAYKALKDYEFNKRNK